MRRSHLPLKTWFLAAHLMAVDSNRISALQAQGQLGIKTCKAAWLMLQKLRWATVSRDQTLLHGIMEVDGASVSFRSETSAAEPPEASEANSRGAAGSGKSSWLGPWISPGAGSHGASA